MNSAKRNTMKPNLSLLLTLPLLLCACNSDLLETTEDPVEDTSVSTMGEEDFLVESDFNRTVTITWSGNSASVEGDDDGFVSINGSQVLADSRSDTTKVVKYILTGSSEDGSFKLYSLRKQALVLKGLDLHSSGAVINNQSHKRTFVILDGVNAMYDGSLLPSGDYSNATDGEDLKAAFFSEGQLVFSGTGSLSLVANGKAGITSDDYIRIISAGMLSSVSYNGHALRGKDALAIEDGSIVASSFADGKKAISSDGPVTINGGELHLATYGGVLLETTESGTELSGAACIKSDGTFTMNGGEVEIGSTGQGGKGISGDGAAFFNGGTLSVTTTGANYGTSGQQGGGPGGNRPPGNRAGWGGSQDTSTDTSTGAKGLKFDGDITITGGIISVKSINSEAIESKGKLTATGGTVYAYSEGDDAINSGGDMNLNGGYVCGYSTGNDGIDANGNLNIDGATVYAVSTKGNPEVALDANSEGGKKLYLKSGTLIAVGGLESGASITGTAYSASSWTKNQWHALYNQNGEQVIAFKAPSSGSGLVVYSNGKSVTLHGKVSCSGKDTIWSDWGYLGSTSDGSEISLNTYSGGGGRL